MYNEPGGAKGLLVRVTLVRYDISCVYFFFWPLTLFAPVGSHLLAYVSWTAMMFENMNG